MLEDFSSGRIPEGGSLLGRPRRRWEENIQMDIKMVGCGLDSSGSGYGTLVGFCGHGNELSRFIKCWEFLE
jgi:hypothetical protein